MGTSAVRCTKCKEFTRQVGVINKRNYCMRDYNDELKKMNRKFGTPKPQIEGRWKRTEFVYSVKVVSNV